LLSLLSVKGLKHLSNLEAVPLEVRQIVETPGDPIPYAYFVVTGLISIVGTTEPNHRIEVGMIGPEGMSGTALVLGAASSACEAIVQSAGTALRIPADQLRKSIVARPEVASLFLRYAQVLMTQQAHTALANGRGKLSERLARWILMWQDRLGGRDIAVTHDFLSLLLGVRRAGVTEALHVLEGQGLIRASRVRLAVLDRKGLKRAAGGFYGIPEAEYVRLIK
jgi:CRP-like cAMP-binding protein